CSDEIVQHAGIGLVTDAYAKQTPSTDAPAPSQIQFLLPDGQVNPLLHSNDKPQFQDKQSLSPSLSTTLVDSPMAEAYYTEYILPPPKTRSPYTEDANDANSIFASNNDTSLRDFTKITANSNSIKSSELRGDATDGPEIVSELREGQLRQAPNISQASSALHDLTIKLRGESRGKSGGYTKPDLDPFVHMRLEGMRTFLNLYTNSKSTTYEKWGA
ncbi:hypothetical protein H0H93_008488, partial [Arthromyces matolae]